jgi:hypothetical protein
MKTFARSEVRDGPYLDIEVLVNLYCFAKDEYELHHTCKFPHVAYFLDERDVSSGFGVLHLSMRALEISRTHCKGRFEIRRRRLSAFRCTPVLDRCRGSTNGHKLPWIRELGVCEIVWRMLWYCEGVASAGATSF